MKLKFFSSESKAAIESTKQASTPLEEKEEANTQGPESEQRESTDGRVGEDAARDADAADTSLIRCAITKSEQTEKLGISFRTSIATKGIYVHNIEEGTKFEATELKSGMKVVKINDEPCPEKLADAIKILKSAKADLVILASPNDEQEETVATTAMAAMNTDMSEIAVDGDLSLCGFFSTMQNVLCMEVAEEDAKAIKNLYSEEDTVLEEPKQDEEAPAEVTEAEPEKKRKLRLSLPSLPKASLPSLPKASLPKPSLSLPRFGKKAEKKDEEKSGETVDEKPVEEKTQETPVEEAEKSSEATDQAAEEPKVEEEEPKVEESTPEIEKITINFKKESLEESVGLALRNSKKTDGIYIYGIFNGSRLIQSELKEKMRLYTINGQTISSCNEAIKMVKEATEIEFVAGPNDEDPEAEKPEEEEKEEAKTGLFGWW